MPSKAKSKRTRQHKPAKPTAATRKRALSMLDTLKREFPDAKIALDYSNALELLVATILSAQCTDARVNMVTPELFKKYRTAQDYVDAPDEELIEIIRSTGFFNNKTKNIKKACESIVERFNGEIPGTMEELTTLAGVGRKTANCLLGNVFDVPGIVVDTHMIRLSRRMGFTTQKDPVKIEFDLMELIPREDWTLFSHLITSHGRTWCSARKPMCDECPVADDCPKLI
ncbi:MAG: endonuclease III [Candidatus Latescibacterota bacterium]